MPEVIRVYRQSLPALRFIGKRYGEQDSANGSYAPKWGEWFQNDWFSPLEAAGKTQAPFDGSDAYIGLCRVREGEPYEYWIGMLLPPDAAVPEGYTSIDFDAFDVGVCWVYGREPDIFMYNSLDRLKAEGYRWAADDNGVKWCFERYVCPRYTTPDEKGNVILDMCFRV